MFGLYTVLLLILPQRTMSQVLYMYLSLYALVKNWLGIPKGGIGKKPWHTRIALHTFIMLLAALLFILLLIVLLPLYILHILIDLYLTLAVGDNYAGLLKGQDSQLETPAEKITINVVLILNCPEDAQELVKKLTNLAQSVHESVYKLSCTVKRFLGFPYYVKNHNKKEDCVQLVRINEEEYITRDQFMDYVHEAHVTKGPAIGNKVWYAKIFPQPIRWSKKSQTAKQYAVILVFRHCLADGIALIGLLKNFMIRESTPELLKLPPTYTAKPHFSFDNLYIYNNPFTAKLDPENLQIKEGSSRQLAIYVEEEIKYVPLVKKLKTKLKVGFTEILVVALTASLNEYAKKRGKRIDFTTVGVVFRPINSDLESIINGTFNYDDLTNDSSAAMIKVPIHMKEGSTLVDRTNVVHNEIQQATYAIDGLMLYTLSKVVHLLPAPVAESLVTYLTSRITPGVTNVGGLKGGKIAGYEVESALSFIPSLYETVFRLSVLTKGDCFMLGLAAKEDHVYNREELQEILNNVFKYIDALDDEIKAM